MDLEESRGNVGRRITHPRHTPRPKRKVESNENRFPGWTRLGYLYNKCPSPVHQNILATLFLSGARVSEAILIKPEQVAWNDEAIYFYDLAVLKSRRTNTRISMIPRDPANPFIVSFISYVESCPTEYLLPAHAKLSGEVIQDKHTTRQTVYRKVREIDDSLFPHLLRGWCAGMLVEEYDLDVFDLQAWFKWVSTSSPSFYARTREEGLRKKLRISKAPKRRKLDE